MSECVEELSLDCGELFS